MAWVKCLVGKRHGSATAVEVRRVRFGWIPILTTNAVRVFGCDHYVECPLLYVDDDDVLIELNEFGGGYTRLFVDESDIEEHLPDEVTA